MKIFSWEAYDGRDIVLCGPLARCVPIMADMPEGFDGNIVICDDNYAERTILQIAEDFREIPAMAARLKLKFITRGELCFYGGCYVFLVGKTFFGQYLKYLGYKGLDDFYCATPLIKNGFAKQTHYTYFAPLFRRQREGLYLGGVEVVVTTGCTLRCRDCANLLQYYTHHDKIPRETILASVRSLINAADGIAMLKILGGEPLLEQRTVREIIDMSEVTASGKVMGVMITTNGTIHFEEELLRSMQSSPLVSVLLSNYKALSGKLDVIIKQLTEYGIPYSVISEDDIWFDFGKPDTVYQTGEAADRLFQVCRAKESCCTVLDGRLYSCPRAAHGERLGLYPRLSGESVELSAERADTASLREELRAFYFRETGAYACRFCTNYPGQIIAERAVQLPR